MTTNIDLRLAGPEHVSVVLSLIRQLAEYERLAHEVVATEQLLHDRLFGPQANAEVVLAWAGEQPIGFALFFHNVSTFVGRRGLSIPRGAAMALASACWFTWPSWPLTAAAPASNGRCSIGMSQRFASTKASALSP
jgi:hypothetical protein